MKKNISINLQGVIFHIEEDAYETLSLYLASVKNYFAAYEGHVEIAADIESRIAELFLAKISPAKQVITLEDVQALIAQMGTVTDFEVMEDEMADLPPYSSAKSQPEADSYQQTASGSAAYTTQAETKRFYRDGSRKLLAGVAAGIANYLSMDPLWIRIAFVFLVIGLPFTGGISGFGILAYIILWIALPETHSLPETPVKKLYRDPDDKKLGGVCSGLGLYFGTDPSIIRVLFLVLFLVFGIGLVLYILLWILVPEAKTLTEKMQMQGNPVTLSSIEHSLKKNLNLKDENGHESTGTKLLLFPIRLLSQVLEWLARNLKPVLLFLVALIRIFAGVLLLFIAGSFLVALGSLLLIGLGVHLSDGFFMSDLPAELVLTDFPVLGIISGFIAGLIPTLMLFVLAIGLLSKRFYMRATVGWSMFGIWLISLFVFISTIAMYQKNFRRVGEYSKQAVIPAPYQTMILDTHVTGLDYNHDLDFEIASHSGSDIIIREVYSARGATEEIGRKNAQMLSYRVQQRDSTVVFDDAMEYKPNSVYRNQQLNVIIRLPEGKNYRITRNMAYLLPSSAFDHDYSNEEVAENVWTVKNNMFTCITCSPRDTLHDTAATSDFDYSADFGGKPNLIRDEGSYGPETRNFDLKGFNKVNAGGNMHIRITQGHNYSIRARGTNELLRKLEVEKNGRTLKIKMDRKFLTMNWRSKPVLIEITTPTLEAVDFSGSIVTEISGITSPNFVFDGSGAIKSFVQVNAVKVVADLTGASEATFSGKADQFIIDATGASSISARNLEARKVQVEVSGAGSATVHATQSLTAEANGAANIIFFGNPSDTSFESNGPSKITKR